MTEMVRVNLGRWGWRGGPGKHSSCSAEDGEALGEQREDTILKSLLKSPWLGDSGGK